MTMRADDKAPTLFLAFARDDLALVRSVAEQLRAEGGALRLDYSLRNEAFDAPLAGYIRPSLLLRIARCAVTLCLLGPHTAEDPWVRWTLDAAKALGRPLYGAPLYGAPPAAAADLIASLGGELVASPHDAVRERLADVRAASPAPSPRSTPLGLTLELFKRQQR